MFTKQHYEALAAVIQQTRAECVNKAEHRAIDEMAVNLATALQEDNHHFNVIEFLCASGIGDSFAASVSADMAHDLAAKLAATPLDERGSKHTCDPDCECWDDPVLTRAIQLACSTGQPVVIHGATLADLLG